MKLTKTLLISLSTLLGCLGLQAQDLHNTLFYMNPLHMNPAFTGAFEGTYRIGGIYRDQSRTAVKNAYSTPAIFIDAPILMIGKRHWIGVGGLVFRDQAGSGRLTTSGIQLSGSFHLSLDKKSNNVLTLGVTYGSVTRRLKDARNLRWEDMIVNETTNSIDAIISGGGTGTGNNSDPNTSFTDINAGLLFKSKVNKTTDYNMGISMRHITTPGSDYNFQASTPDLSMRFIAHAQLNTALTDKWSLTPELYYTNISPASQFQLHTWAGYMIKPEKNIKVSAGLGYRFGDSGQVLLGLDYGDIKAAFAYDITLSELSEVNSYQGGFEIAVYYVGKIYKKPDVKPAILCPHL
jgi:type IX secretion system PorP/SprF family membrane protein